MLNALKKVVFFKSIVVHVIYVNKLSQNDLQNSKIFLQSNLLLPKNTHSIRKCVLGSVRST